MQNDATRGALRAAIALTLGLFAFGSRAETLDFVAGTRNLSPVAGLFALEPPVPRAGDGIALSLATASHSVGESEGNDVVLFDGETTVLSLTATRSVGEDWRVALTLPCVWHETGSLDAFIDDWHAWFGFPDGIRDDVPRDDLRFRYLRAGTPAVDLTRNTRGVGDARLAAAWSPAALSSRGLSLALGLKLPTGSADRLTGSGAADVSAALHWQRGAPDRRWAFDASAGVAFLGDADIDLGNQRRVAWLGHFGAAYRVSDGFTLGARAQLHTGPVSDAPDPLSATSVIVVVGGALQLGSDWRLDIAVDEDLNVETAPDVVFRAGLVRRFD